MIIGAHSIIYSKDPDADRAFFREVVGLPSVDVGGGWLIFGLPPAEVAVHPAEQNGEHELYLMCDDVQAFVGEMHERNLECGPVSDQRWGLLTELTLPGGGKLGVYEPRHQRPAAPMTAAKAKPRRPAARARTSAPKKKPANPKKPAPAPRKRPKQRR
jgi:hypothetical protein